MRNVFIYNIARAALPALIVFAAPAMCASIDYYVDTTDDLPDDGMTVSACHTSAGTCSVRAAIMKANQRTGSGITAIHVPPGTYTLTIAPSGTDGDDTGDLNLTASGQFIDIEGAGAERTIIDGSQIIDRVITVDAGRTGIINGLTIRYGTAQTGGGIFNLGVLGIRSCVIEYNIAHLFGGGIYSLGNLQVTSSTIRFNAANAFGGGIYAVGSTSIYNSTVHDNSADNGGGIYGGVPLYIVNSTISGNTANVNGGGIYGVGTAALYSSSIVGNASDYDHDNSGGIGGGVYAAAGSSVTVVNTIVAGNTTAVFTDDDCNGALTSFGFNLFGSFAGCTLSGNPASVSTVSINTLGPLQDNGGPTLTHALLPGSFAIDSTYAQGCINESGTTLMTDQRGYPRIAGARCDVGAFEYGADGIFADGFE